MHIGLRKSSVWKPVEKRPLGKPKTDGEITLRWKREKWVTRMGGGWKRFRVVSNGVSCISMLNIRVLVPES
jgi:hypothetical protein